MVQVKLSSSATPITPAVAERTRRQPGGKSQICLCGGGTAVGENSTVSEGQKQGGVLLGSGDLGIPLLKLATVQ